jgi:hypothetical protein
VAYQAAAGATLACSNACTCSMQVSCTGGVVTYFQDNACQSANKLAVAATGTCVNQGGSGGTYASYNFTSTLNASCTTGGSSAATVGLNGEQTICCSP